MSKVPAFPPLPATKEADPLLSLRDVADRLNVGLETVRQLALRGEIRFLRVGKIYRFRESWLEQFIEGSNRRRR